MNIPNFIDTKIVNKDGSLTDTWKQILMQTFSELQKNVSAEGYIVPQQTTANITQLNNTKSTGSLLYDKNTSQLKINLNGEFKHLLTEGSASGLDPDYALISDTNGDVVTSPTTAEELEHSSGVTSNIQSQLNGKEPAITSGTSLEYWRGDKTFQTLDTKAVPENTNLYYTDERARLSVSSSATGISYDNLTGVFKLTTGYVIPTTTEESNWNTAYNNYVSSWTAPLGFSSGTASISQADAKTDGYLTSTNYSNWESAYSNMVSTWTSPLQYSTGTASINQADAKTDGYLSSTDWSTFNNKQDALISTGLHTGAFLAWNGSAWVETQPTDNHGVFWNLDATIGAYSTATSYSEMSPSGLGISDVSMGWSEYNVDHLQIWMSGYTKIRCGVDFNTYTGFHDIETFLSYGASYHQLKNNDNSVVQFALTGTTFGTDQIQSFLGVTLDNSVILKCNDGDTVPINGLLIGCTGDVPIIFGNNDIEKARIDSSGITTGSGGTIETIGDVPYGEGNQSAGTPGVDAPYYSGAGLHYQIKVWAYKTVGDYTVYSQNPYTIDFYDDLYSPPEWFWIRWTWDAVSEATGYKIQYSIMGDTPFGAYLYCTTNELIDRWYLSTPAWQYVSGITTPSSPGAAYSITALTVNDNADIKGNLDVGNILRVKSIITESPLSLGTTNQKGMLTIDSAAMFPGIYIDSVLGGNLCLNTPDGIDQLRFSVNDIVVSSAIIYADASIEWWGGSNGSIYFNGNSSIDAPGGFGATGTDTGLSFYNGNSIKDNGDDLYVTSPNTTFLKAITLEPTDTAPTSPIEGMMYVDNTSGNHLYIYLNSGWNLIV